MGQISNTTTLRKQNTNLSSINIKQITNRFFFIENFKRLLFKKNVILADCTLNTVNSTVFLTLKLFFNTKKIKKIKKKIKKIKKKKNQKKSNKKKKLITFLNNQFKEIKNNKICIKSINLNRSINKKNLIKLYLETKSYMKQIFTRRFNLYYDFLKLTTLFLEKKISTIIFLNTIGIIFKALHKKKHGSFIFFIKYLFNHFIILKKIKGIKFILNGKIKGKTRASTIKFSIGAVPIQSFNKVITFHKIHVYTLYGVFGLKLWVNN